MQQKDNLPSAVMTAEFNVWLLAADKLKLLFVLELQKYYVDMF